MKLPVSIMFHNDETPLGFTSRLAAANGYPSLDIFLGFTDATTSSIARGDPEAIALLAAWSGYECDNLARYAVRTGHVSHGFHLGEALFSRENRRGRIHRFCVKCIQEDYRNGKGRRVARPYVRVWWETRGVKTCPVHGSHITEVPCESGQDDFARFVESNPHLFKDDAGESKTDCPRELDSYLIARIRGAKTCPFLDELEAYVAADLCKYLGRFLHRYRNAAHDEHNAPHELDVVEYGFSCAKCGQDHMSQQVSAILRDNSMKSRHVRYPLDPIPRWLRRHLNSPTHSTLVELFQDIGERNTPLGEGQLVIVPASKRYLHNVRSASVEYGLMENRVVELLKGAGILATGEVPGYKSCFDAELAKPILQAAQETLCITEAESFLKMTSRRLHEMIEAGFLRQVEADRGDKRAYTRIKKEDLLEFQRRLFERAEIRTDLEGYLPIWKATQRCNCQLRDLVEMIFTGQLHDIARIDGPLIFPNLYIHWKSAKEKRRSLVKEEIDDQLLTIAEAAAVLKTTQYKVYPLVASKFLPPITRYNPLTRRNQPFLDPKSLEEFKRVHISIAGIASLYRTRADAIARRLELLNIKPSYDPGIRSGRYYRRSDLKNLTFDTAST
tara:strand:- start:9490 stop:11334 length:1845 start_codon:yes stop_codon:yes gene_type:complete